MFQRLSSFYSQPQLILFFNPDKIIAWIEERQAHNKSATRVKILYDGQCRFCRMSIRRIEFMDLFQRYEFVDFRLVDDLTDIHPDLKLPLCERQMILVNTDQSILAGFFVFRKISWDLPMMWLLIPILYMPGSGILGPLGVCCNRAKSIPICRKLTTCRSLPNIDLIFFKSFIFQPLA